MFGLTPDIIRNIKEAFSKFSQIEKVILYGSRAKGNYKDGSDIDITLLGENLNLKTVYALETVIEELYLPYTFDISIFTQINNDDLIEHILSVGKVFYTKNNPQLPKDFEKKKLSELSTKKDAVVSGPFGSNLKVSDYKTEGIPILRLQNIGKGYFIEKDIKYISEEKAEELKYHSFISGDIVLAKLGIPIGKTCIIPNHFKSGIITADIVRIRPDTKNVDYKYLEYFLNTDLSVAQLTKNISGATRPKVNLSNARDIEIPLPPLPEQKRIVKKLDALSAKTKKLEAIYQQKIDDLEELKKSILQKAFNGELT